MNTITLNYVLLGQMKAEFEEACRRIDDVGEKAKREQLQAAWKKLLDGDTDGRDHHCQRCEDAFEAVEKAKVEAWYRIGEDHGISRDEASAMLKLIQH